MEKIKIEDLSKVIMEEVSNYSKEVEEKMDEATEEVVKETVVHVKSTAPKGRRRKYSRSFRKEKTGKHSFSVNAGKEAPLSHLLENGHATRSGGRTRAFPHMKEAEDFAYNLIDKKIIEKLGK